MFCNLLLFFKVALTNLFMNFRSHLPKYTKMHAGLLTGFHLTDTLLWEKLTLNKIHVILTILNMDIPNA